MADQWFAQYPSLEFERRAHGVLLITIARPEAMNATDAALHKGLSRIWDDIDADDETRVVVITGKGKAFSAGGDLDWIATMVGDYAGMKAAFPYIDDFLPAGTLASLERLGEVLSGERLGTARRGAAVTHATTVAPSLGIASSEFDPPKAIDAGSVDKGAARPLT